MVKDIRSGKRRLQNRVCLIKFINLVFLDVSPVAFIRFCFFQQIQAAHCRCSRRTGILAFTEYLSASSATRVFLFIHPDA